MLKRSTRPVLLIAALAVLSLVAAAPSYATLAAPVGFNTSTGAPVPAFGWNAVSGADHYEFQISGAQGFNAPLEDITNIKNTRVTLDKSIADCNCTWRVRALSATNVAGPWSAAVDYDKVTPLVTTDTPADGDTVTYPTPIVLTWEPLEGASKYEVLIGDSPTFAGVTAKETSATFYVPPTWLAPGTHYWSVAPKDADGNVGSYTPAQSFDWVWPNTVDNLTVTDSLDSTGDDAADAAIFEPRFSWDPVPGAARYEIEINTDSNWASGSIAYEEDQVLATTVSPDVLLPNGDYYWRVRAFDPSGFAGDWSFGGNQTDPGDTFNQTYDLATDTVPNLHMRDLTDPGTDIDLGTAGYQTDTPIVSWDSVPGASYYDVELHPFQNGACQWAIGPTQSSLVYQDKTTSTSWTPLGTSPGGNPVAGQSAANDGFSPKLVAGTSYCVRVRPERDGKVAAQWTVLDPTGDQFAFQFTGYPTNGNPCSPSCSNSNYLGSDDYLEPQSGVTESNTPLFTWNAIAGMKSYFIVVSTDPTFASGYVDYAFTQVNAYAPRTSSSYKAYADFAVPLYWQVLPSDMLNGSTANGFPGLGAHAMFHKQTVAPLNLGPADGADQTGRPTFTWTTVPGARDYHIQIADDPGFGAGHVKEDIGSSSGGTYPTTYTSLNNAFAQGNYWWRVQAFDQAGHGLAWSTPTKFVQKYAKPTFTLVSNPAQGAMIPVLQWDPMMGAVSYDVHLVCSGQGTSCTDGSNIQSTAAPIVKLTGLGPIGYQIRAGFKNASGNPTPGPYSDVQTFSRTIPPPANMVELATANTLLFSWDGRPGADRYSVQVARNTSFASITESYDTRFTSYAPRLSASDFTNGGGFYWRVAAKDGDGNLGQWSNPMAITLPLKISASVNPSSIHKGVYTTVTITVKDYGGTVVAGANVKLSGGGISPAPKKTTAAGKAVFKIKPTRTGKITVTVTKLNCKTTTTSVTVS